MKNIRKTLRIHRTPTITLEDFLKVFRRKYLKPKSKASAKHRFNRLTFTQRTRNLRNSVEELQKNAENAFGKNAQQRAENFFHAKMPPRLKNQITKHT